jgi:hypothetical protein
MQNLDHSIWIAAVIIIASVVLSGLSLLQESATLDEIAHITAGYSYWTTCGFRLNAEHPALVKLVAGIPLVAMDLADIKECKGWKEANAYKVGFDLFDRTPVLFKPALLAARLPMIAISSLLLIFTFLFARNCAGSRAGVVAIFLLGFEPLFIAHSKIVSTDIAAALGWTLAAFSFHRLMRNSGNKNILFFSFAAGFAALAKFSTLVVVPFFFGWWLLMSIQTNLRSLQMRKFLISLGEMCIAVVGILVMISGCYHFDREWPPDATLQFLSQTIGSDYANTCGSLFGAIGIPWYYLHGLDLLWIHNMQGHCAFLNGNFSETGWIHYFLAGFLMK